MKTQLLAFFFIISFLATFSQVLTYEYRSGKTDTIDNVEGWLDYSIAKWNLLSKNAIKHNKKYNIKKRTKNYYKFKKDTLEKRKSIIYYYNKTGNYDSIHIINTRKNKLIKREIFMYNANNLLVEYKYYRNNKLRTNEKFDYDKNNNVISYKLIRNGKQKKYWQAKYNLDFNKRTEFITYKKNKPEIKSNWVFTYYPDGSKKESVFYKNNKFKYKHSYICNDEGVFSKDNEDTAHICKSTMIDNNGNKKEIYEHTYPDGKVYKTVTTFNSEDLIINYSAYYKNKIVRKYVWLVF